MLIPILFLLWAGVSLAFAVRTFQISTSAAHEIQAHLAIITAVLAVGFAGVIHELKNFRRRMDADTEKKTVGSN